jgi:competence protein ComEC
MVGAAGIARRALAAGDAPIAPGGVWRVAVLHPPAAARGLGENDASLVLLVRYGATRVLFTGDVEAAGEALLGRTAPMLAATVMKVPHHGSRTSSTRALLARVRPGLAVALLGARNRFGFPAHEVRERYGALGAAWRQTDRAGEVVVASDGQLEHVTTCRPTTE